MRPPGVGAESKKRARWGSIRSTVIVAAFLKRLRDPRGPHRVLSASLSRRLCWQHGCAGYLQIIVLAQFINYRRYRPTRHEDAHDDEAERAEVIAWRLDRVPRAPAQAELIRDDAGPLDSADDQRHEYRHDGDHHIVVKLSHR